MASFEQLLKKQLETIQRLELFFDVYKCKKNVRPELEQLSSDRAESGGSVLETKEYLYTQSYETSQQYAAVMRKMRRNEILMLHLMQHIATGASHGRTNKENDGNAGNTKALPIEVATALPGRMFISDYQKSPFVSKSKVKAMNFLDFDVDICADSFEQIPKYMRGRMQLEELSQFLSTDIVKCFEEKYTLMYKNRAALGNQQEMTRWKQYKQEQSQFPNQRFITQENIVQRTGKLVDKKTYSKLQILRHLHILQEVRTQGSVYYLWTYEKGACI